MVPARHTSALFISGFRSTTVRLLRRFRRVGCSSGREWPLSLEGTARAEVLCVYHDSVKLLKDDAVLPSLQVRVVQASVQGTSMCILFSEESSFPPGVVAAPGRLRLLDCDAAWLSLLQVWVCSEDMLCLQFFKTWFLVNTSGRALGCCCGGVLRGQRWDIVAALVVFTSFQDTRHDLVRFFGVFFFCRSPCCVVSSVLSQATKILFVRSASRWSIGDEQGHRFLRFPAPRLLFNGAQFHSPEVRGFLRLLHCEQSVQQSR